MTTTYAQNIGSVTKKDDGSFEGKLSLMAYQGDIVILPVTDAKEGADAPDFTVNTVSQTGTLFRVGSARNKVGKTSRKPYVAVVINHFEITAKPIFGNLVADKNNKGQMNILV